MGARPRTVKLRVANAAALGQADRERGAQSKKMQLGAVTPPRPPLRHRAWELGNKVQAPAHHSHWVPVPELGSWSSLSGPQPLPRASRLHGDRHSRGPTGTRPASVSGPAFEYESGVRLLLSLDKQNLARLCFLETCIEGTPSSSPEFPVPLGSWSQRSCLDALSGPLLCACAPGAAR